MTPISFLRQLYSLDTLDTRFTTSARTPVKVADADPAQATKPQDDKTSAPSPAGASPSRWRTPEFYFYALVFIVVVPQMFKAVVDVSQREYRPRAVERLQAFLHADTDKLQLRIRITPNSPTVSRLGGYPVAKSYVEELETWTAGADLLGVGQLR